jgi:hypothetical protein
MAYTLGKVRVRVKDAILWIAEHAYPEEFQENRRAPVKRVRQAIQDAFEKGLPGSEGIRPTKSKSLPNSAYLKAPPFFTWAAGRWPLLSLQEGIPRQPITGRIRLPPFKVKGSAFQTPLDPAELENQFNAAKNEESRLRLENDTMRVERDAMRTEIGSLKKQLDECENKRTQTSEIRSNAASKGWARRKR